MLENTRAQYDSWITILLSAHEHWRRYRAYNMLPKTFFIVALLSLVYVPPAHADFAEATAAFRNGEYETAFTEFRVLADRGDPEAQYTLGHMYQLGTGIAQDDTPVNLYAAYYENQNEGNAVHSPRSCLPGGGWEVEVFDMFPIGRLPVPGGVLAVNRVLIRNGTAQQLVYYWFVQRDRVLTSGYEVKWYLMWDALTRGRSDGALIRLVTPIAQWELPQDADERLRSFLDLSVPELQRYMPLD